MRTINTLKTIKEQYREELYQFAENASIDEINQLSNKIHHGVSKENCGAWSKPLTTFTSCDNENCQMLSESLAIIATLPSPYGRPEFFTSIFNGNTKEQQKKQKKRDIVQQYYAQLPKPFSSQYQDQLGIAYSHILKKDWSSIEEFSALINKQFNNTTLIGYIKKEPKTNNANSGAITFTLITHELRSIKDSKTTAKNTEHHNIVVIGELAEMIKSSAFKDALVYLEGKNRTSKWQDENGKDHYTTEVVVEGFQGVIQIIK